MKCNYCGRENPQLVFTFFNENHPVSACPNCAQFYNTCRLCTNNASCEFETNPSPIPKQVMQTIRQGNMVVQTAVPNPERTKAFCTDCGCYSTDPPMCLRQFGTCGKYNEYIPSPTPVEENAPLEENK